MAWPTLVRSQVLGPLCTPMAAYLQVGQDAYESTDGSLGTSVLEGHTDTVVCTAFNSQGTHLATGGMDGGWRWHNYAHTHCEHLHGCKVER